jgi:hypothetical protein
LESLDASFLRIKKKPEYYDEWDSLEGPKGTRANFAKRVTKAINTGHSRKEAIESACRTEKARRDSFLQALSSSRSLLPDMPVDDIVARAEDYYKSMGFVFPPASKDGWRPGTEDSVDTYWKEHSTPKTSLVRFRRLAEQEGFKFDEAIKPVKPGKDWLFYSSHPNKYQVTFEDFRYRWNQGLSCEEAMDPPDLFVYWAGAACESKATYRTFKERVENGEKRSTAIKHTPERGPMFLACKEHVEQKCSEASLRSSLNSVSRRLTNSNEAALRSAVNSVSI